MEISHQKIGEVTVVHLAGELTAQTKDEAEEKVLQLSAPGAKMILEMSGISFMGSAGLRMLVVLYRNINGRGGKIVLVGLSENLQSTMLVIGFLDLFQHYPTLGAGLAALECGMPG